MKWYKHLAKSIDNPFVRQLMYEFGSDAYLVFFGTLEIYSDNFSPENGWKLTVSLRYFHEKFLLSNSKIKNILAKITEWEVTFNKDEVTIFIPKFKELLDNYTSDNSNKTSKKLPSDKEETFQARRIKKKNKEEDKRNKYADAVFLSNEEYEKLKKEIGGELLSKAIEQLDYSITVKGGKYKDHYKTILNWNKRGFLNATGNQGRNFNSYRSNNNNQRTADEVFDRIGAEIREIEQKASIRDTKQIP